jgi:hypothetical protein
MITVSGSRQLPNAKTTRSQSVLFGSKTSIRIATRAKQALPQELGGGRLSAWQLQTVTAMRKCEVNHGADAKHFPMPFTQATLRVSRLVTSTHYVSGIWRAILRDIRRFVVHLETEKSNLRKYSVAKCKGFDAWPESLRVSNQQESGCPKSVGGRRCRPQGEF